MAFVASQVESVLSPQNIPYDLGLQSVMDADGYVPVKELLDHPRVKGLVMDTEDLVQALQGHQLLEVSVRAPCYRNRLLPFSSTPSHFITEPVHMVRQLPRQAVIVTQLEYWFSDENLATDAVLGHLITDGPMGYVPVKSLLTFNRMKAIRANEWEVAEAAMLSPLLELSHDRGFIRRRQGTRSLSNSPRLSSSPPFHLDLGKISPPLAYTEEVPLASPSTQQAIRKQVEYYFSDQNFLFDRFLQQLGKNCTAEALGLDMSASEDDVTQYGGWVSIDQLVKFPRLATLKTSSADLIVALTESPAVKISGDGCLLRRSTPLPPVPAIITEKEIKYGLSLPDADSTSFTVMQYNVLADHLARENWFPYTSDDTRSWLRRRELIRREILYHSPDLLCLQEVQTFLVEKPDGTVMAVQSGHLARENHVSWFAHWLRSSEYGFRYARKQPYAGQHCQGVTIGNMVCWKESVFEVLEEKDVILSKEIAKCFPESEAAAQSSQMGQFCHRSVDHFCAGYGQVACMVRLRHRRTGKELILATVHITANYQSPHVQVMQVQACLKSLEAFSSVTGGSHSGRVGRHAQLSKVPVILCGDFNCTPDSGVIQLIKQGSLSNTHCDLATATEARLILPYPNPKHSFHFNSSHDWQASKHSNATPQLTNYTHNFCGTLDYIWFTHDRGLGITAALGGLPSEVLSKETGLPSSRFPSDHLPVLCQLKLL
jgi:mRNA deadenylase 3'-5' endonuclease subunit Ccr4